MLSFIHILTCDVEEPLTKSTSGFNNKDGWEGLGPVHWAATLALYITFGDRVPCKCKHLVVWLHVLYIGDIWTRRIYNNAVLS